jgi:ACS family tartrate transporter-like MFS transporter
MFAISRIRSVLVVLVAAACVAVAALGYVGAALLAHPVLRVVSLALVPAGVYGFLAPFWCLPSAILRGVAAAVGIAFVNSFGNLGGFVGPYALGVLKDATGSTTERCSACNDGPAAAAMCLVLDDRQPAQGQASGGPVRVDGAQRAS